MNAYELAEQLKHWSGNRDELWNAANTLRQQADRIEDLEKSIDSCFAFQNQQADRIAELEKELDLYKPEDDHSKTVCHTCDGTGLCDRA